MCCCCDGPQKKTKEEAISESSVDKKGVFFLFLLLTADFWVSDKTSAIFLLNHPWVTQTDKSRFRYWICKCLQIKQLQMVTMIRAGGGSALEQNAIWWTQTGLSRLLVCVSAWTDDSDGFPKFPTSVKQVWLDKLFCARWRLRIMWLW